MKVGPGPTRALSQRPSQAMFKLAVEAVTTGRIPPGLQEKAPMKALMAVAYVFFLDELMTARIDMRRAAKTTLAKHHERAWQKAETLLMNPPRY